MILNVNQKQKPIVYTQKIIGTKQSHQTTREESKKRKEQKETRKQSNWQ